MNGDRQPTSGEVHKANDTSVGMLSQDITIDLSHTLRATAMQAFIEVLALQDTIDDLQHEVSHRTDYESDAYMKIVQKLTDAHEMFERRGGLTMHADLERVLTGLGFEQNELDMPLTAFSGGWQMRAELGRLLLSRPRVLLLDEPTNHLDIESVQWLEEFLSNYDGAVILVSHDRTFLDNVTNRTIEITRSRIHDAPVAYSDYEILRDERLEQQRTAAIKQARERARIQKFVDRFRYKATLATRVQSRIKHLQKMDIVEVEDVDTSSMHFTFPSAPRAGRVVAECINLSKSYDSKLVLDNVNFHLERGEKVAFIGKNGEGKTTLSKIIAGTEAASSGEIRIGYGVNIGYYAQHQADMLGGHQTLLEVLEQAAPAAMRPRIRTLLGAFLFSGDEVNKRVSVLSGGEKSRLALARMLLQPTNLLILDEPTNHLDMLSKEVLKQALLEFEGAMIVVSHDRDFLDGLTDRVIAFRKGHVYEYEGDIDDYVNVTRGQANKGANANGSIAVAGNAPVEVTNTPPDSKRHSDVKYLERKKEKELAKERIKLEKRIADIERQVEVQEKTIAECEVELADPELYKDTVRQHKITSKYETARKLVVSLTDEWTQCQQQLQEAQL
jgi:ATP-binding cassette subfamily F protein 3